MSRASALAARLVAFAALGALAAGAHVARAQDAAPRPERAQVDRVAVRYWAPETGGAARPRFITERVLAFEARLEALSEGAGGPGAYQDRHVRAAIDRDVSEELLSALLIQRGTEPPAMAKRTEAARGALLDRVGGLAALDAAMSAEGIDDTEVSQLVRRQVRAAYYVDTALQPILSPTEEDLRAVFRTDAHPFRGAKFEDVRERLARWLVVERLHQAESAFLQAARTRVKIVDVPNGAH